ncbi:OmpA family protein [Jannaschia sp. R86511]|uniref:OmpA family protein n=1 Tax=Jannaschia sp. R86511 TaxID=3093853 RepID=UPI0036D354A7
MRSTTRPAAAALAALALTGLAAAPATASGTAPAPSPAAPSGAASTPAEAQTVTSSEGVEVTTYGTTRVAPSLDSDAPPVYQAVHAVQRVQDVTVVYFSVGWADDTSADGFSSLGRSPFDSDILNTYGSVTFVNVALPEQGQLLYAVPDPEDAGGSPRALSSGTEALPDGPGVMNAMYAVLPGLPDGVDTVDVTLGHAGIVTGVPVGDGLLEPTVTEAQVPLGTGWPEVPASSLVPPAAPAASVRPLAAVTEDIDGFSREAEAGEQVTLDIAADVLFAFDSADLSDAAVARLEEVAAEVADRAAPGELQVVGHTDSNGSDAYNDDLSLRRAESVADVLRPALASADLELVVEGRGEREPVADNATEDGRQLNRRVSVSFTETTGQD